MSAAAVFFRGTNAQAGITAGTMLSLFCAENGLYCGRISYTSLECTGNHHIRHQNCIEKRFSCCNIFIYCIKWVSVSSLIIGSPYSNICQMQPYVECGWHFPTIFFYVSKVHLRKDSWKVVCIRWPLKNYGQTTKNPSSKPSKIKSFGQNIVEIICTNEQERCFDVNVLNSCFQNNKMFIRW